MYYVYMYKERLTDHWTLQMSFDWRLESIQNHSKLINFRNDGQQRLRKNRKTSVMPINGNALAKYLVMVSQVIAWCTVSAMLLRRGLNQVNAASQQPPSPLSYDSKPYGGPDMAFNDSNATSTAATDSNHQKHGTSAEKSFNENGTPAVVAGVVMIAIAVIMLIISPTIMVMKIIEKRKKRILDTVSMQRIKTKN